MRFKKIASGAGVGLVALGLVSGCGGGGGSSSGPGAGSGGTTVTDNPITTVPWSGIVGQSNVAATMRVNDSGTTVTEIGANIISASIISINVSGVQESGVEGLYCMATNGRGVFEGDSGSPVLINGSIVGGLFGSSDNEHFYARGIQQMEATQNGPPILGGRNPALMPRVTPKRYFEGSKNVYNILHSKPNFGNLVYVGSAPGKGKMPLGPGNSVPPIPGRRFASPFVIGQFVEGFDMATYTLELSNGNWVATGHGLEDAGTVSWPVTSVSVSGLDASTDSVNADVQGGIYGTLLYDGQNGSLINPNVAARTMPVTVNATISSVPQGAVVSQVRFDLGSSTEDQAIEVAGQATIDGEDANPDKSLNATGNIVLTVGGGTVTKTLSFPGGQSLTNLENTLGSDIDAILVSQHSAAPTQQIQQVVINLTVTG